MSRNPTGQTHRGCHARPRDQSITKHHTAVARASVLDLASTEPAQPIATAQVERTWANSLVCRSKLALYFHLLKPPGKTSKHISSSDKFLLKSNNIEVYMENAPIPAKIWLC